MDISSTKTMRKLELILLLLLLLICIISPIISTEASSNIPFLLTDPEQGRSDVGLAKMDGVTKLDQSGEMEGEGTDWNNMMGIEFEQCSDEIDECLKRRLISEAHLDYIYTQHQKP